MKKLITIVLMLALSAAFGFAQTAEKKAEPAKAAPVVEKKVEAVTPAPTAKMVGEITIKAIPAMTVVDVSEKAADFVPKEGYAAGMEGADAAMKAMWKDAMGKLDAWMKAGGKPTGPCFGIYDQDPTKTPAKDLTCKIGFPVTADTKGTEAVKAETLPAKDAAVCQFSGPYEGSGAIYNDLMKWIPEHGQMFAGSPMEIYLKGEMDKVKPEEYLTEIQFPIMKMTGEMKAPAAPATPDKPAMPVEPKKDATPTPTGGGK